jgi:hypothetical protein
LANSNAPHDRYGRHDPGTNHVRTEEIVGVCPETWVLQGTAAAQTGFSISAIRKWRRMGLVADRKLMTPSGAERVEVRLEDVLARAAMHPEREQVPLGAPTEPRAEAGTVVIRISDLEALFERMMDAERRATQAENDLEPLRAQNRFISGQLSELRRQQLQGNVAAPPPVGPDPRGSQPPAPTTPAANPLNAGNPVKPQAPDAMPPAPPRLASTTSGASAADREAARLEQLADRLRRIYARLDAYRRDAVVTPAAERQRQQELAEYDRVLVALCSALSIPTGSDERQSLTVERRGSLTRALVQAGMDVRVKTTRSTGARPAQ